MYSLPDSNNLKWQNFKPPEIIAGSQVFHINFDIPKVLAFAIWTICSQISMFDHFFNPHNNSWVYFVDFPFEILVVILLMPYMIVFLQYNDERMEFLYLLLNINWFSWWLLFLNIQLWYIWWKTLRKLWCLKRRIPSKVEKDQRTIKSTLLKM